MPKKKELKKEKKRSAVRDVAAMILFIIFISSTLLTSFFSTYYMSKYTSVIQDNMEERLYTECRAVRNMISAQQLGEFITSADMNSSEYKKMLYNLQVYAEENNLAYAYILRLVDGNIQYILDSDPSPKTHLGLNDFDKPTDIMLKAFNGETASSSIGDNVDGKEGLLSAYVPIYDDNDNVVAIVGVEISDTEIVQSRDSSRILTNAVSVSTVCLVITAVLVMLMYSRRSKESNDANIAKSEFLSRMSHEIRTPMNAIMGFCQIAQKENDPKKKREYINNINNAAEYLLDLINNILDISKIEARKMNLNIEKVSIKKIMTDIEILLSSQIVTKKQKLKVTASPDIPNFVYCDPTRIRQIIINLASNAIKFTPENGTIEVSASLIESTEGHCNIEFSVKDTGKGIAKDALARIFEPFEQENGGITRNYGGTGLGLAISKLFVEMMGGKISVTSEIDKGTQFTFNITADIVAKEDEPIQEEEIDDNPIDCAGMTFLVVEDSKINQEIAKSVFEDLGATVEFANDGKEGVEKFTQAPEKYRIIFMDIQMPVMDGFEATRQIRASDTKTSKTIPIIAMTAEVFQEDIDNALKAGMDEHLGKPFKISELITVIKRTIDKSGGKEWKKF